MSDEQNANEAAAQVDATPIARVFPYVVKLARPITFGNKTIEALTFRKGRVGDIKGIKLAKEVPTECLITIASRLCGEPTNVIEMLDIDDGGQEAMDVAMDFFTRCLGSS